ALERRLDQLGDAGGEPMLAKEARVGRSLADHRHQLPATRTQTPGPWPSSKQKERTPQGPTLRVEMIMSVLTLDENSPSRKALEAITTARAITPRPSRRGDACLRQAR